MQFQLGHRVDVESVDGQFEGRGGWRRERRALSVDRHLVSPLCSPVSQKDGGMGAGVICAKTVDDVASGSGQSNHLDQWQRIDLENLPVQNPRDFRIARTSRIHLVSDPATSSLLCVSIQNMNREGRPDPAGPGCESFLRD